MCAAQTLANQLLMATGVGQAQAALGGIETTSICMLQVRPAGCYRHACYDHPIIVHNKSTLQLVVPVLFIAGRLGWPAAGLEEKNGVAKLLQTKSGTCTPSCKCAQHPACNKLLACPCQLTEHRIAVAGACRACSATVGAKQANAVCKQRPCPQRLMLVRSPEVLPCPCRQLRRRACPRRPRRAVR